MPNMEASKKQLHLWQDFSFLLGFLQWQPDFWVQTARSAVFNFETNAEVTCAKDDAAYLHRVPRFCELP